MSRALIYTVVVALVLSLGYGCLESHRVDERLAAFELQSAQADSAWAVAHRVNDRLKPVVDSLQKQNAALRVRLQHRAASTDSAIVVVQAAPVPDTCLTIVKIRDQLLTQARTERDSALTLYDSEKQASDSLRRIIAADSAAQVTDSLARAAARAAIAPLRRQSLLDRLTPHTGAGGFAGICTDGKPCAGYGLTLSWRIHL